MYCVPTEQAEPTTELGRRLRRLRLGAGLSPNQLGELAGVSQPTVWRIETGETESPGVKTLELIAGALKVPVSELTGETTAALRESRPTYYARVIPHHERPSAGTPVGADDEPFTIPVASVQEARLGLHWFQISGDCLRGTINDGDEVLVQPADDPQRLKPGAIVLIEHGAELLCKRVVKLDGQIVLVADDGTAFHADETTRLLGVVRKVIKNL